ncbi:MAG: hypothetical protein HONBIEJF_02181 [Fimbriimonadaceae bacterium]|nr:hypothetical protein [Fimbriimonadaceae bacterium]
MTRADLKSRFLIYLFAILTLLAGCGGSGGGADQMTGEGSAELTIDWPEQTRLIPIAANSITVSFLDGSSVLQSQTVSRPPAGTSRTTVTFTNLPVRPLTLRAEAFPSNNGSGVPQASATKSVTILAGSTSNLTITMDSTIDRLEVTPLAPTVVVGNTVQLGMGALDLLGRTVLTANSTVSWESSDTSIATVDANGLVTGVAIGTANITVRESESGKSTAVPIAVTSATISSLAGLANLYINSLTAAQQQATVVGETASDAARWSVGPASPDADGSHSLRNGVSYSSLTNEQREHWDRFVRAALGTTGYQRMSEVRKANTALGMIRGGYNADYIYLGFVGRPTENGNWMMQLSGNNYATNLYFTGSTLKSSTPYFLAAEPQTFNDGGTLYAPLQQQHKAIQALIVSLNTDQLNAAKLPGTYADVMLGEGKDARSNFLTGTTDRGIPTSMLTGDQRDLLRAAIAAWTQDSPVGGPYQALYEADIEGTYVGFAGSPLMTNHGDYARIDGPHVWIEFVCVNGSVFTGTISFRSIWRDKSSDYNAAFGF